MTRGSQRRGPPRCVYCGKTRPRVIVAGGKAHRYCIPRGSRQVAFDDLSKHQQRALIDMVARGGLFRIEAGWSGVHVHRHGTIFSLQRNGLCDLGTPRAADATERGRALVVAMVTETNAIIRRSEASW